MSVLLYYAAMTAAAAQELELGLWTGLKQVYAQMTRQRRRQFAAVLALMLAGGLAELATIGSVVPFLGLLSQPGATMALPWPVPMLGALGERIGVGAVTAAALVFAGFAVIAGLVRLLLTRATQDFIYRLGQELMLEAQRRILLQPYPFYMERNTSTLISSIEKVEIFVLALLLPLMQMLTAAVLAAFIVAALLVVDQVTAIVAAAVFSGVYLLVSALTRKRLAANSAVLKTAYNERLKIAQESLGGIRDVILENSQSMHLALFDRVNGRLARARATTAFISTAPRYIIETAGIVAIAAMALLISARDGGVGLALPILGAIALGAQRLLPLLQQIYAGWSNSAGYLSLIGQVVEFLRLPVPPRAGSDRANPLPFNDRITLEGVSFGYVSRPKSPALESVTFDIRRGEMIALTGETGCGKSTLADLLMGLLQPSEGRICVDSAEITPANARRWQQNVAHVPQSIFLADTTIGRNIALSHADEALDLPRIVEAARMARVHDFIETLPQGYDTLVGERGVRLSGGQRQRLGLARAIYKQAPLLVLDEATSALDEATEAAVIDGLEKLRSDGCTIVVIAHRLSTISRCDRVAKLHKGRLVEVGSVTEIAVPVPNGRRRRPGRERSGRAPVRR